METMALPECKGLENDECPRPEYPSHIVDWFEICQRNPYLRLLSGWPKHEPIAPSPMKLDEFAKLVGSLRAPTHRQILRELLIDLLAEDVVKLVQTMRERGIL